MNIYLNILKIHTTMEGEAKSIQTVTCKEKQGT